MRYWIYAGASWLVSFAVILPLITRTEYDSKDGTCIVDWSSETDDEASEGEVENLIFGALEDTSKPNTLKDCSGRTYMYLEKLYIFAIGGEFGGTTIKLIHFKNNFFLSFNIRLSFDTDISLLCSTGCSCSRYQN